MPAGCVQCAAGEWQCGSDTTELCAGAGGWTPAGALCLQLFVRKHPKSGNCLVRVELKPVASCSGMGGGKAKVPVNVLVTAPPIAKARARKATKRKT